MHILFVCTGNICRSPLAERLSIALANRAGMKDFRASSAGTQAVISHAMHREAAKVLESLGGESTGFAARQLTPKVAGATDLDLILTMTRAHRETVLELAPRQLRRTFTLVEAAQLVTKFELADIADLAALRSQLRPTDDLDIADPIGKDAEVFATVGDQIASHIQPVMETLERLGVQHR